MKLRNILYGLAIIAFLTSKLWGQNTNPVVENVLFNISGQTVTVTYDIKDAAQTSVTIRMEVSSNNGTTWDFNYGTATGVGTISGVLTTFTNKTITWTYSGASNDQFQIRIFANDESADGSPCAGTPTVIDSRDSKVYNTVQIGTQCWLKENLDVGTMIQGSQNAANNGVVEKYCYNNDANNCNTYGGLYQWAEAVQYLNGATNTAVTNPVFSGNVQGICPTGWHIPTYDEFQTLVEAISNNSNALKAVGQGTGVGVGTNTSGFSALLAGNRLGDGYFYSLDANTTFWSSTESSTTNSFYLLFSYSLSNFYLTGNNKESGFSIRCLKD